MPGPPKLPLPVEPAPPVLIAQETTAHGAADLAESALWRYHLRYWHEHAAQDEVFVTASFNIAPPHETTTVADAAPPRIDDRLSAQLVYSDDSERIEALRLTREDGEPGSAGRWPYAEHLSSGGPIVALGNGTGDGTVRTYAFDPPMVSEGWSNTIGLTWDALDLAHSQNARASLCVVRNRGLVAEGATTDVVYRTATVDAPDVATPLNRWLQDVDISDLGDTVEAALEAAFCVLFGERRIGQQVTLGLYYGYQPFPQTGSDAAPMMTVPVAMVPHLPIAAETAAQIAATLAAWKEENQPVTMGGHWLFSLALFSQVDTRTPLALLELGSLVYRLR